MGLLIGLTTACDKAVGPVGEAGSKPDRSAVASTKGAPTDAQKLQAARDLLSPPSRLKTLTLDALRKGLAGARDAKARRGVLDRLTEATVQDAPRLHEWLHRKLDLSATDLKAILKRAGASVPDARGRFSSTGGESEVDWLEALLKLDPGSFSKAGRRSFDECLLTVALLRSLAASGHPDASISLLRFGFRHQGAFRDECGRQIRAMGVSAVPGLIRVKQIKDAEAQKMIRYATYQLDRMNCTRPDHVLKMGGPEQQVELLHAYGEVRDMSSVSAVLSFTDADSEKVRRAARWAMLRFVSGRPPRAIKRKLKLAGGRQTDVERTLYLTYQQLAAHALAERLARELAPERQQPWEQIKRELRAEVEPRQLAEQLFALLDQRRETAREKEVDRALGLGRTGQLDQALAAFDAILAAQPFHPRRAAMAPYYFQKGKDHFAKNRKPQAIMFITKALHLAPAAAFRKEAQAWQLLCEGLLDAPSSPARDAKLRQALVLYPGLTRARWELDRVERDLNRRLFVAGGLGGGVALGLMLGLSLLRRRMDP